MSMSMSMIPLMQEVSTSVLLLVKFAIKAPLDQNTVAR
jgi:hypothetical protein